MAKVFVSYGGPDEEFADKLTQRLRSFGFETFFFKDRSRAGLKIHRVMRDGISDSDFTVLICSSTSLVRAGVIAEIEECLSKEARLGGEIVMVPITLDDFVFSDWSPKYSGHAQAVRDRVIADFRSTQKNERRFQRACLSLRDALSVARTDIPDTQAVNAGYDVEIVDPDGRIAILKYTKTFRVLRGGNPALDLPDLSGSGRIEILGCNLGNLTSSIDEGGRRRLEFSPFSPLIEGRLYNLEVMMKALDCYMESTESVSTYFHRAYPQSNIVVRIPEERPVKKCRLVRIFGSQRVDMSNFSVSEGGCLITVKIIEPISGAQYLLTWDW